MTKQSDEKKAKLDIKTRQPQKRTDSGIFANLRQLPHPVEEILGLRSPDQDQDRTQDQKPTEPMNSLADHQLSQPILAKEEPSRPSAKPAASLAKEELSRPLAKLIIDQVSCYRMPNFIDDELMPTLQPSEQIVLRRLCRLSFGFNRDVTDSVSLARLAERCNLGIATIKLAVKSLEAKGIIEIFSDSSRSPTGGNKYRIIAKPAISLADIKPSRSLAKPTIDSIKDHEDLKNTTDHQSETKRKYQSLTGNSWTKADQSAYEKIKYVPLEIIGSTIQAVLDRAKEQPRSLNYFVAEILSGGQAGKSREAQRKKIEKIALRIRDLHVGGDLDGFRAHVEKECAREGVVFDLDLFNEIIGA